MKFHLKASVRGMLRKPDSYFAGLLEKDGVPLGPGEARHELVKHLEQGHQVIPCCPAQECPDFDYTGPGCPGHPDRPEDYK